MASAGGFGVYCGTDANGASNTTQRFWVNGAGLVRLPTDDSKLQIGASQDIEIYHNGTYSFIKNATGSLTLQSPGLIQLLNADASEYYIEAVENGAVSLYYDNSKKFETTSTGVTVTGDVQLGSGSDLNKELRFADSSRNDASSIKVDNSTADLLITNDRGSGAIRLATNSAERLRIDSSGRVGVGKTPASYHSNNKAVITGDSGYAIYGRGSDTLIISQNHYYDSSDVGKYVADGEGTFYRQANGVHEFWTAGSGSADAGISLAEKVRIQNGGGISFNGDTAAANALSDYEEGTFTAAITVDTGTNPSQNAYTHRYAYYRKIGKLVHFRVDVQFGAISSTGSGSTVLSGLPFASSNSTQAYGVTFSSGYSPNWGSNNAPTAAYINTNSSEMYLMKNTVADGVSYVNSANIVNGTRLICGGTYMTDS